MEALNCQECYNKEQKGAKARYKYITTGSENFKYPLCRRCYNKLKRETRINPNEQPLVTPTSVNSSVSDDSLPASTAVTRTAASFAAAIYAGAVTTLAPSTDESHSSLNRAQTGHNNSARNPGRSPDSIRRAVVHAIAQKSVVPLMICANPTPFPAALHDHLPDKGLLMMALLLKSDELHPPVFPVKVLDPSEFLSSIFPHDDIFKATSITIDRCKGIDCQKNV